MKTENRAGSRRKAKREANKWYLDIDIQKVGKVGRWPNSSGVYWVCLYQHRHGETI